MTQRCASAGSIGGRRSLDPQGESGGNGYGAPSYADVGELGPANFRPNEVSSRSATGNGARLGDPLRVETPGMASRLISGPRSLIPRNVLPCWRTVGRVFVRAVMMDAIYQFLVERWFYPGEAVVVAIVLATVPDLLVPGPVNSCPAFAL
jgi:hypothetical protein